MKPTKANQYQTRHHDYLLLIDHFLRREGSRIPIKWPRRNHLLQEIYGDEPVAPLPNVPYLSDAAIRRTATTEFRLPNRTYTHLPASGPMVYWAGLPSCAAADSVLTA
ncbi:hypothetical protein P175DRAFT_0527162 [Aspergillus ochraceoroseus IBT 24754]|uniref:Uncharacterized protein n=1 Tax=Aspergillus ochraceoroseus IBT 24754 TaxID=1392256 RepID=A0A2T5M5A7_9EURO|nr:uncharacterized protein P175DRAFT_0527162 [Aspergillus ochraceoroseus IBT 24754]PTU23712.1 hypothetical protein P175DRAFT_0527162 [Aspergillus ochraceoroseus IBT 24754]